MAKISSNGAFKLGEVKVRRHHRHNVDIIGQHSDHIFVLCSDGRVLTSYVREFGYNKGHRTHYTVYAKISDPSKRTIETVRNHLVRKGYELLEA